MINKNIIGSVSPLKARKSKGKAGKVGMKATATRAQDKSGFSRSGVVPSGKGYMSNLESLTAGTRLTSSLADALGRSGTGKAITGKNDFGKTDEFDKIETGYEYESDPDKITKKKVHIGSWDYDKEGRLPTYEEAWDLNLENIHKTYGTLEEYIRRRTDPNRKKNPNYKRPDYVEGGSYVEEVVNGEHRRRPYKITNGKKEWTGEWEVYTP